MKSGCDLFCVGNVVADVVVRAVDRLPPPGTIQILEQVALAPGGNGVNTALAMARLGKSVRLAGAVGRDRMGQLIRQSVREEEIDDANLVDLDETATSVTLALVDETGERRFLHMLGANGVFSGEHIDWSRVEGARIFHSASTFVLPAFDGAPLADAMARAKRFGCLTSLDVCWDTQGRRLSLLEPALPHTDIMFPNLEEGRQLTGEKEPPAIAAELRRRGVKTVVVKLGAEGCYVEGPEGAFTSPAFPVTPLDTTAAGDCFNAAFLDSLLEGCNHRQAARVANAAAALSIRAPGSTGAPRREELDSFLAEHPSESPVGGGS